MNKVIIGPPCITINYYKDPLLNNIINSKINNKKDLLNYKN